jgi:hypothetical protein
MTDEQRLQMITDQLILVRDNLFRGMSKSIQKLQARSINEVLELENFTRSAPVQGPYSAPVKEMWPAVPDAFGTREGEHPQYIQGWNDCRAEMLKGMK